LRAGSRNEGHMLRKILVIGVTTILASSLGAGTRLAAKATAASFSVASYGAKGNGTADNTAAFAAAIAAAEAAGGGTVYVPAGTYAFTANSGHLGGSGASIQLLGTAPVELLGASAGTSKLVEHVSHQTLVMVGSDGSSVEDLTLNAQSYLGGYALMVRANNTLLEGADVLGADITTTGSGQVPGGPPFALYYAGPLAAEPATPAYNTGNQLLDDDVEDGVNNDGFSFSFQEDASISHINYFGSRLALYVDKDVKIDDYDFTPNPACGEAAQGFWITPPSSDITISNFTTSGAGGVVSGSTSGPYMATDIKITDETFTSATGGFLEIGNVDGLTLTNTDFNTGNFLMVNPETTASGIVVTGPNVPGIEFATNHGKPYRSVAMELKDVSFPSFSLAGKPVATFREFGAGPTAVTVDGGSWSNLDGGFNSGTNATFTVLDSPTIK